MKWDEDVHRLSWMEMRMIRWMCRAITNNRPGIIGAELRERMGIECISGVMRRGRLKVLRGWWRAFG